MQRRIEVIQLSTLRYRRTNKKQGWLEDFIAGAVIAVIIIQLLTA